MTVTLELMYEVLKEVQERLKRIENQQREGFASLRSHVAALHSDQTITLRRLDGAETDLDRLKTAVAFVDEDNPE